MIIEGLGGSKLLCEELEDHTLRLRRVFASQDVLEIPAQVGAQTITVIGAYCFAQQGRLSEALMRELQNAGLGDGTTATSTRLRPVNGDYLRELTLPDTVKELETYAFYNCRKLEHLITGAELAEIHSDAFMNCRSLHTLTLRADASEITGLPYLLNQLTAELCVEFEGREKIRLLYPEYSESYEEIGPAHIFSLHVEGEGYRARKQFVNGKLDFGGYDAVFEKARNEEQFLTLMKMALYRLEYPYELSEKTKQVYENYVKEHEVAVLEQLVAQKEESTLQLLCRQSTISDEAIQAAVIKAVSEGWTRGVAAIIRWRNEDAY